MIVIGLAFWAYRENYQTQDAISEVSRLKREIKRQKQTLAILKAEWAYLNRPERLRDLAMLNFERLRLLDFTPKQFGKIDQISFPSVATALPITNSVEVSAPQEASQ